MARSRTIYWIVTVLFCLQMGFTAYAQLRLPQVAAMFTHLGFPDYFRVELSWAKFLGLAVVVSPAPVWLKEWAHAGFVITLGSALIAHFALGDGAGGLGLGCGNVRALGVILFLSGGGCGGG